VERRDIYHCLRERLLCISPLLFILKTAAGEKMRFCLFCGRGETRLFWLINLSLSLYLSDGAAGNVHREPFVIRSISPDTHRRSRMHHAKRERLGWSTSEECVSHTPRPRESDWAECDPIKYSNWTHSRGDDSFALVLVAPLMNN